MKFTCLKKNIEEFLKIGENFIDENSEFKIINVF